MRILLVEDNVVNQKIVLRLLTTLGRHADVAATGREALEAVRHQPYDVVLMDVQMPEMSGLEATAHIRRDVPAEAQPWIIALTANAMRGDRERCLESGMNDYLSKPIKRELLAEALDKVSTLTPVKRHHA